MGHGAAILMAYMASTFAEYGHYKSYPYKCYFCPTRDTFRMDKEKQTYVCYKYGDSVGDCPKFHDDYIKFASDTLADDSRKDTK